MKCENCDKEAVRHERFCHSCRQAVLSSMARAGYLTPLIATTIEYRNIDARQRSDEQHIRIDPDGWGENAIRAWEDEPSEQS